MPVAWIGLGNMGGPMAANLVAAGHNVRGFDLSESARSAAARAGVTIVETVAEAVGEADIVFTMLPAGAHVRAVLSGPDGVLAHLRPGAHRHRQFHDRARCRDRIPRVGHGQGFRFLDAPVSGGIFGAQAGTLTFMVGGSDAICQTPAA